eukprot:3863979-Alexandrium_andersonii.AAC.1
MCIRDRGCSPRPEAACAGGASWVVLTMAPGYCSCGGRYTHHRCSRDCSMPEGPVLRAKRAARYARDARAFTWRAVQ